MRRSKQGLAGGGTACSSPATASRASGIAGLHRPAGRRDLMDRVQHQQVLEVGEDVEDHPLRSRPAGLPRAAIRRVTAALAPPPLPAQHPPQAPDDTGRAPGRGAVGKIEYLSEVADTLADQPI